MTPKVVNCLHERYDVYIGRPSIWGNPFSHVSGKSGIIKVKTREDAISRYVEWLTQHPELIERAKKELKGKILGCWCKPKACHGDILLTIANKE